MLLPFRLPKTLLWVFNLLVIFLMMFTAYRLVTLLAFMPEGEQWSDMLPTFFLGMRFDLRWISIILLPIIIASLIPELSPFYSLRNRRVWTWYLAVVTFFIIFFFAADFGCFSYNKTRLAASALNFVEDPGISATMLWQSYPIGWMLLGLFIAVLLLRMMFRRLHGTVMLRTDGKGIPYQRKWFVAAIFFFGFFVYGNVGAEPLKWNAAFRFNNSFRSFLALNPLQNFFYTLKLRRTEYDETKARTYFPLVQSWMGLNNADFSYKRTVAPGARRASPNVVLVMCESFSMYKSSMSGNPLNTTPYFKSLSDSGIFFNRCFTPHFSTARGLFATLTGIPDVQLSKFSTRNPEALDQHTIINEFQGYEKFYFLGGSPSFNNFEGLVKNIEGVQMNVEGHFSSKPVDVWGISDKNLFLEANKTFAKQTKPFFAIVQTADNHRPFTIPAEDTGSFSREVLPNEALEKYGFESLAEYNAFRYADYCIRQFMEAARKEAYFNNTIFVFVGDHGVSGNAKNIYPAAWTSERLTEEHVPLLFYAPGLLQPQKREEVVSQIDVLPTVAGLAGISYTNTTLGRDLLRSGGNHFAFVILHDEGRIGMVTDDYYFTKNLHFQKEEVHVLKPGLSYTAQQKDSIRKKMTEITSGFYETAKWMLVHNKK
ncbi:MAG TPA: LTA synthase family protein [Flavisolibacter sp.]|nr:LTA synthase family protein [Flavisolibacter sp.]